MPKLTVLKSTNSAAELDRRQSRRILQELIAVGKVILSPAGPELVGQEVEFLTRDVSTTGLLVRSTQNLPVGCLLDLSLSVPARDEPLVLQALIKWNSADTERSEFILGLELRERPPEEYRQWRDRVLKQIRFVDF